MTPNSLHYLLRNLLATNTYWELKTTLARAVPTGDGAWVVTLDVGARKVRVDRAGTETEVPMDELVQVGVFAKSGPEAAPPLYLHKGRIQSETNKLVIRVLKEPQEAGIDPRHLLLDAELGDNSRPVMVAPTASGK